MEILKSDLSAFDAIRDFNYKPQFVTFNGMQMHYIDVGQGPTILALHGQPTWSYLYRKLIPGLSNYRFIAPDLIGFGKSDKLLNWVDYSFDLHFNSLLNLVDKLDLKDIILVVQDWGGPLGLSLLSKIADKISSLVILNTYLPKGNKLPFLFKVWQKYAKYHPSLPIGKIIQRFTFSELPPEVVSAYDAPFNNKQFKTGPKSFPQLVPSAPSHQGVNEMLQARKMLSNWSKPALVMFSDSDPIFSGKEKFFHDLIPSCHDQPYIIIKEAGHFLQEDKGEQIANYINLFLDKKLPASR